MTMRLRFWGTRGSIPSPGPHTVRYGGNTPCVEVRTESNGLVILDAGTGIRELGRSLLAERRVHGGGATGGIAADIFLTHAHWDHVQGIPFFAPIFQAGNRFTISAPTTAGGGTSIGDVIRDQMGPAVFPVSFSELKAQIDFSEIGERERREGDGYAVTAFGVQHPGGALGYRFAGRTAQGGSFVYISDNELGGGPADGYPAHAGWREELIEFVRGATLLVHDATYTPREYERHRGWGHSTMDEALALALEAQVQELLLFHHKPERSDDEMDRCVADCQAQAAAHGSTLRVRAAAEGMTLSV
ncbi:MAG: putative phytochrome sensor protein [Gemmatimonadetes bacterium]|nr:putative phytochrome sensor protein [Gemmatimonadota bacterium]